MIHRISRKKFKIYAMDFETHNDDESIRNNTSGVWLAVILDETTKIDDESCYMYSIEAFLERIRSLASLPIRDKVTGQRNCKNVCLYDWNLSFEWSFILPALLSMGFTYKEKIEKDDEYVYNTISTRSCSSVWMVNLKFGKRDGSIIMRDLAKIYSGSLREVAKSFNLETQKGDIDYRKNRLSPDYVPTKEEKEYCWKDVRIIVEILENMNGRDDNEFWNSSSASTYSMKKLIKMGYPRTTKPFLKYREEYPCLDQEQTNFLRRGVGGGITYCPKKWMFKEINVPILHIDMHQAHPTSLVDNVMPYGDGKYFKGEPRIAMGIQCACRIRVSYSGVKLHSVIQLIGLNFIDDIEIVVWDFEINTMYECYENLEVEYIDGYEYKTRLAPFRKYFISNYNKRLQAKRIGDDFNTMYFKLLNNSAYGKFLEKPHNERFENCLDENGIITSNVVEKPLEQWTIGAKYTYIPLGSSIPARTRCRLVETALLFGWENICYFDTDSIFIIDSPEARKILHEKVDLEDHLGGWGVEAIHERGQFTSPKRYKVMTEGKTDIKAGGINFNAYKEEKIDEYIKKNNLNVTELERQDMINDYDIPFDEVDIISSTWMVQRAYRCKGGTLIRFQEKAMDVQEKYAHTYEENTGLVYHKKKK